METSSSSGTQFFARTMRHSDLDLVVKNEAAAYAHPWTKRIFIDCLRAGYQAWVLANKQEIAAHGVMSVAVEECHLLTLCVHPAFQRMGYGRKLLPCFWIVPPASRQRRVFWRCGFPMTERSVFIALSDSLRLVSDQIIIRETRGGRMR